MLKVAASVTSQSPEDFGAEFLGQGPDPLFERFALIGEGEFGARLMGGLGDPPGNRTIVGNPEDQATFPSENSRGLQAM